MSKADVIFKDMCESIIDSNISTKNEIVRPHWEDGTPAYTIKKFGVCNRYDLQEEFPAITFRKTGIKTATKEILWIYQKKSNSIKDLDAHIWDEWADETGSIGKAYGYQVGKTHVHHQTTISNFELLDRDEYPSFAYRYNKSNYRDVSQFKLNSFLMMLNTNRVSYDEAENMLKGIYNKDLSINVLLDQIDSVIYDLKHTPYSRRIMTNLYNLDELHEMNLYPCAYSCTFNVTDDGYDKPRLNLLLNQRSQDILAANNWNVCQYAVLLMMIAQSCDMIPGQLVHMIADAHIYDRHVDIIKELIKRPMYDAPKVTLNPDIHNFYKFTVDDLTIENYVAGEQIKNIPIAI